MVSVEATTITVTWDDLPCPLQHGPISGYVIEYTPDGGTPSITGLSGNNQVSGLTNCTKYKLRIAALNNVGSSDYSLPLSVVTSEIGKA